MALPSSLERMADLIETFNRDDEELYHQHIPNAEAADWMSANVPLLDCPDDDVQRTYYFRWWVFRKHLKATADGFVVTEFLPTVAHAGSHNTISCAAAHHFREGRWLRDQSYLDDYARFWLLGDGEPRAYSFWIADSMLAQAAVSGHFECCAKLLPELVRNYLSWEASNRDANGLYWQRDDRDGMEWSISGRLAPQERGYRATINSYMYGDAMAIATIADRLGDTRTSAAFRNRARKLKHLMRHLLWDEEARFFKVLPRVEGARLADVRELHGYTPWYFDIPDDDMADAWQQLQLPTGFQAPYGPTTAERRHRDFTVCYMRKGCQWNGPSWPFATAITLTGLANLLDGHMQTVVSKDDYWQVLRAYTFSHRLRLDDGREVCWIDENLNPFTGDWLTRTTKKLALGTGGTGWTDGQADPALGQERGKDYNHSTYCDLIISGLFGLRPQCDDRLIINPLIPDHWEYCRLERILYHGTDLCISFDRHGHRYGQGAGLRVSCNGQEIASTPSAQRLETHLPDR